MKLISHRIRGFDFHDQTLTGLKYALSEKVTGVEIDLRLTKDNQFVINHDAHLNQHFKSELFIKDLTLKEIKQIEYRNNSYERIASLTEILEIFSKHSNSETLLCLDVKCFGEEEQLVSIITRFGLTKQCIIISWLPEVLLKIHSLIPEITLCFSFYPAKPSPFFNLKRLSIIIIDFLIKKLRVKNISAASNFGNFLNTLHLFDNYNRESILAKQFTDCEHYVTGKIKGELESALKESKGWVCMNYKKIDEKIVTIYKEQGFNIALYSVNNEQIINALVSKYSIDFILTDIAKYCVNLK